MTENIYTNYISIIIIYYYLIQEKKKGNVNVNQSQSFRRPSLPLHVPNLKTSGTSESMYNLSNLHRCSNNYIHDEIMEKLNETLICLDTFQTIFNMVNIPENMDRIEKDDKTDSSYDSSIDNNKSFELSKSFEINKPIDANKPFELNKSFDNNKYFTEGNSDKINTSFIIKH